MIINLLKDLADSNIALLFIYTFAVCTINVLFIYIGKWLKDKSRSARLAFFLQIISPGSGYAYASAVVYSWINIGLFVCALISMLLIHSDDMKALIFLASLLIPAFGSAHYANQARRRIHQKEKEKKQQQREEKMSEIMNAYRHGLLEHVQRGYHVAVDTNFLMHYHQVLFQLYQEARFDLYLHPTVFGELEGLKKSSDWNTRNAAQLGFDILELYQKAHRLQWTRKDSRIKDADQRIVMGIASEVKAGTLLVFASHDKGARILARSLHIPAVDPYYQKGTG
ncbi:PIN domain-containing protein [Bacillus sp. CGMCC 1.16541]|uniref:PIN domain-containing protein n=1 Tax=Bacillus sp. CGMCC 1.16541 TaxID=2185143 RepID=UPI000D73A108|nr:PIN domain-containing protein [Bacillus sp. CGMCC 1.16541]